MVFRPISLFLTSLLLIEKSMLVVAEAAKKGICPDKEAGSFCPEGCWHESGIAFSNGFNKCEEVGFGYYSPQNENLRYSCEPGTFSNLEKAVMCISCPMGTYSPMRGQSGCVACPTGTFSGMLGSITCDPCDPTFYQGVGANTKQVWGGISYCVLSSEFIPLPTTENALPPSSVPTMLVSLYPSQLDTKSVTPSVAPMVSLSTPTDLINQTLTNNMTIEVFNPDQSARSQCEDNQFKWHSKCSKCPSKTESIVFPVLVVLGLTGVICFVYHLPAHTIPVFWIGLEYLQVSYLLELSSHSWTRSFKWLRLLFSIISLDLDSVFSLQCLLEISPQGDQIWILSLPITVGPLLWIIPKIQKELPDMMGVIALLFYLGHTKLVLTCLEAVRCSPFSWFCHEQKTMTLLGTTYLILYGLALPIWFIRTLYKRDKGQESSIINHWARHFPHQDTRWRWASFCMARKTILAILLAIFTNSPRLTLIYFLVTILASDILQRKVLPSPDNSNHQLPKWFQSKAVDVVLYVCLLTLWGVNCAITFTHSSSSVPSTSKSMFLSVSFLIIWVFSLLYWILALMLSYSSSKANQDLVYRPKPRPPSFPPSQALGMLSAHIGNNENPIGSWCEEIEDHSSLQERHLSIFHSDFKVNKSDADSTQHISSATTAVTTRCYPGAVVLPNGDQENSRKEAIAVLVDSKRKDDNKGVDDEESGGPTNLQRTGRSRILEQRMEIQYGGHNE
jgi:hypothetical protein